MRLRSGLNWLNLSTPAGLLLARLSGADVAAHHDRTYLATGYRWRFPKARAFTVGNVILTSATPREILARPALLRHEDRHCSQYALLAGPGLWPVYGAAMAVSWAISGDRAAFHPLERWAGLAEGGYQRRPLRRFGR